MSFWSPKKSEGDLSSLSDRQLGDEADTATLRTDALNDIATLKKDFPEAKALWEDCVNRLETAESASEHGHVESISEIVAAANAVVKKLAELKKLQSKFDDGIKILKGEINVEVVNLSPVIATRTRAALAGIQQRLEQFKLLEKAPVGSPQWHALDEEFAAIGTRWQNVVKASLDFDRRNASVYTKPREFYLAKMESDFSAAEALLKEKPGAKVHLEKAREFCERTKANFSEENLGDVIQDLVGVEYELAQARNA